MREVWIYEEKDKTNEYITGGKIVFRKMDVYSMFHSRPASPLIVAYFKDISLSQEPSVEEFRSKLPPAGYVNLLAVFEGWQSKGIGKKLLDTVVNEQKKAGNKLLFLFVSDFNPRAQNFYKREGFQFVGVVKDYLKIGKSELLMVKNIS
eukprot:TRINITY_DN356_c0_g1_i1.p1 TRINITY_DN356_c0_g1~~TRINITY_DN356_c0_g1_i1.p1  ORF type:complete len:149 (-),score=14.89 TRINITY_DN356_c0_g1_i1:140-586(-)